jgi:hypothetical protein
MICKIVKNSFREDPAPGNWFAALVEFPVANLNITPLLDNGPLKKGRICAPPLKAGEILFGMKWRPAMRR